MEMEMFVLLTTLIPIALTTALSIVIVVALCYFYRKVLIFMLRFFIMDILWECIEHYYSVRRFIYINIYIFLNRYIRMK